MNIHLGAPFAAVISLSWLGFVGFDTVESGLREPTISGWAEYTAPVRPGQTVMIDWHIDKREKCRGENGRIWDGAGGYHLSEQHRENGLRATDGEEVFPIPTEVPWTAPDGELRLTISGYNDCPNREREYFTLGPVVLTVVGEMNDPEGDL